MPRPSDVRSLGYFERQGNPAPVKRTEWVSRLSAATEEERMSRGTSIGDRVFLKVSWVLASTVVRPLDQVKPCTPPPPGSHDSGCAGK